MSLRTDADIEHGGALVFDPERLVWGSVGDCCKGAREAMEAPLGPEEMPAGRDGQSSRPGRGCAICSATRSTPPRARVPPSFEWAARNSGGCGCTRASMSVGGQGALEGERERNSREDCASWDCEYPAMMPQNEGGAGQADGTGGSGAGFSKARRQDPEPTTAPSNTHRSRGSPCMALAPEVQFSTPTRVRGVRLSDDVGAEVAAGSYRTAVYKVYYNYEFTYPGTDATEAYVAETYVRINYPCFSALAIGVPPDLGNKVPVVVFVGGAQEEGVTSVETKGTNFLPMAYLATGARVAGSVVRPGVPSYTVEYNNPGHARVPTATSYAATGDFFADATPENFTGDDYCGGMTMQAMDAVMLVVIAVVRDLEGRVAGGGIGSGRSATLILSSFSNGLTCASRWMANTWLKLVWPIHALIDFEGPSDSLEQTVMTDCFDPFGSTAIPYTSPSYNAWSDCGISAGAHVPCLAGAAKPKFDDAWGYFFRPPVDILARFGAVRSVNAPFDTTATRCNHRSFPTFDEWYGTGFVPGGPFWPGSTAHGFAQFWSDRQAKKWLPSRQGIYVRLNGLYDHAQPDHMNNRHAVKCLNAALLSSAGGVYAADLSYVDAVLGGDTAVAPSLVTSSYNLTDPASWPGWKNLDTPDSPPGTKWRLQVDLARWVAGI